MRTHDLRVATIVKWTGLLLVLWELLVPRRAMGGGWTQLVNKETDATRGLGPMLLLSDGTVMAQYFGGTKWYRLTPDVHGSYVNGTWTTLAPMNSGNRQYHSSAVLRDGRVFVAGAELGPGWNSAEVYDPVNNNWKYASIPRGLITANNVPNSAGDNTAGFSDSGCVILPDGTVMVAPVFPVTPNGMVIYNPVANSFSAGPASLQWQNETSWVKLPDGSILTIDKSATTSERYIPSLQQWIPDAPAPQIYSASGSEIGAGFLLSDGRAFFLGGNGSTAFYKPSGNTSWGTWAQGPPMPPGMVARDTPAAMMSNGKILCALSAGANPIGQETPVFFYEFDRLANGGAGKFTAVGSPQNPTVGSSDGNNISDYYSMLDLPDGTILFSDAAFDATGSTLYVYQPDCCPLPEGKPAVSSITANADGSYHLTGTKLNGISQGASYGDDAQMDSNYPLVRLTKGGNVFHALYYARTYNWSSTGVQTGNTPVTTEFTLPPELQNPGSYALEVVANGIASDAISFDGPVWVAFGGTDTGDGTFERPYNTLARGRDVASLLDPALIIIKGPSSTTETLRIAARMTITAKGGPVTIGRN
jgi:hypothetical protein